MQSLLSGQLAFGDTEVIPQKHRQLSLPDGLFENRCGLTEVRSWIFSNPFFIRGQREQDVVANNRYGVADCLYFSRLAMATTGEVYRLRFRGSESGKGRSTMGTSNPKVLV
jgi:hypothetical protein